MTLMSDTNERQKITWTTRIAVRPSIREGFKQMAKEEAVSIANLIGVAMEQYYQTARSS